MKFFKQRHINRLLVKVRENEAYLKELAKTDCTNAYIRGRLAAGIERLRQLGCKEKVTES